MAELTYEFLEEQSVYTVKDDTGTYLLSRFPDIMVAMNDHQNFPKNKPRMVIPAKYLELFKCLVELGRISHKDGLVFLEGPGKYCEFHRQPRGNNTEHSCDECTMAVQRNISELFLEDLTQRFEQKVQDEDTESLSDEDDGGDDTESLSDEDDGGDGTGNILDKWHQENIRLCIKLGVTICLAIVLNNLW
jgi:hypothetical protein